MTEVLYGRAPPSLRTYISGSTAVASLDGSLNHHCQLLQVLEENLALIQIRMRSLANAGRQDRSFEVGNWVWLKLKPYRQLSVRGLGSPKLAKRYFRLYQITKKIGVVAYELALPEDAQIHPVFHISKLKPFFGSPPTQIPSLEPSVTCTMVELKPVSILDTRVVRSARGDRHQFLV